MKAQERRHTKPAAFPGQPAHLSDGPEHLLLVRVHLGEGPNLRQVDILTVAQGNDFIEGKNQVKAVLRDLVLLQSPTVFGDLGRGKHFTGVSIDKPVQTFSFCCSQTSQLRWTLHPSSAPLSRFSQLYVADKQKDEVLLSLVFLR